MKSKQAQLRKSEEAQVVADTAPSPRTGRRRIQLLAGDDARETLQDLTDEGRQQAADYLRMRWQRDLSLGIAAATFLGFVGVLWWLSGGTRSAPAAPPPTVAVVSIPEPAVEGAGGTQAPREEVERTVEAWATAWSSQDVESYLTSYAAGFRVPGGASRDAWEARRRSLILEPRLIAITLANLEIELNGTSSATARFAQTYVSPGYGDRVLKTLAMVQEEGHWRILEEGSTPLPD